MNNVVSALIISNFLAAAIFVVSYHRKANWRAHVTGRHMMSFMVVVTSAFGLGVLTIIFGSDYVGRDYVRAAVQAAITFVLWWRVALLYKIQHDDERGTGVAKVYDESNGRLLPAIPGPDAPSEPLAPVVFVSGAVTSLLALLVAFNVHLSDAQEKAILGLVPFVVGAAVWLWGRRRVFSPATVHNMFAQVAANRSRWIAEADTKAATSGITTSGGFIYPAEDTETR